MTDAPRTSEGYSLNAAPDVPDIRDRPFEPSLVPVPDSLAPDRALLAILDQGQEGACTGFGLAAVVNLQRHLKYGAEAPLVSPRMLYEMARRFDEWTGEDYEGSSIRGALRGFYNNGICTDQAWPYDASDPGHLTLDRAREARQISLGAYYRVRPDIAEMHAALNEAGAVYASSRVHEGWFDASQGVIEPQPLIPNGGHAFAIVGYDADGFLIQNSWGPGWGNGGLALWTYADWARSVTDAWVLRIGAPTPAAFDVRTRSGFGLAAEKSDTKAAPRRLDIAGHFVHIDDGDFHHRGRYHSDLGDVIETFSYLHENVATFPRLLLYAHGGLNSPKASAGRIAAMKDTFKANGIYPFHFMYDTGLMEELKDIISEKSEESEDRAGGFSDFTDKIVEGLIGRIGGTIWDEMKEGADQAFATTGAGTQTIEVLAEALTGMDIEVHIVGHSLGSIFMGHLLDRIVQTSHWPFDIRTLTLLAPACRADFYADHYRPRMTPGAAGAGDVASFAMYCLNDDREQDDTVTFAYRKSLLYLVSNAFETPKKTPLLGMQVFADDADLSVADQVVYAGTGDGAVTDSRTHGGFDNDPATMNSILRRILGDEEPARLFTKESLAY